jgi:predicted NBD/HSP70 family sugar kinase
MLGVELEDTRATLVSIDDRGEVRARDRVDISGSLSAAVGAAIDRLRDPGSAGHPDHVVAGTPGHHPLLGVATPAVDSPAVTSALAELSTHFAGPFVKQGPVPSGMAAAVGEAWVGAARGARDVVYFAVADHAVSGIIRDGVAIAGARGRAGSVAWLALNPVEREDYRKVGCLEAEVARSGIVRRLIWRIKAGDKSSVQDLVANDLAAITVQHVLDAARRQDGVSISVVRDTAKYLGMAAANLVAIADPEVLVLGGIMSTATDLLLDSVRLEMSRRLPRTMMNALVIVPAALGDEAAAVGAARLATLAR